MYILQKKFFPLKVTVEKKRYTEHTRDWWYRVLTLCTSNPQVYRGSQWDKKNEALVINKDSTAPSIFMLFSKNYSNCWKRQILPVVLQQTWWRMFPTAWYNCAENVLVSICCADGVWPKGHTDILLEHTGTFFIPFYRNKHSGMPHSSFIYWNFCTLVTTYMNLTRQMKIWQTLENKTYLTHMLNITVPTEH